MKKPLIALLLALVLALSFALTACKHTNHKQNKDDNAKVVTGTFEYYPIFDGDEPKEETYYYSDDYFTASGKEDNAHLMTTSFCLAISSAENRDYTHLKKMLTEMGFCDFVAEDIYEKPTKDSVGTVISHKKIGDNSVIAVVIRSFMYDSEWASNLTVGKTGDAKGFSDGRDKVVERLKNYISEYGLKNNKIWVTGYSRGGGISNLVGVTINNDLVTYDTTEDDLYIYAFSPAAACADDTVYDNIKVVINLNDPVVYVCPISWGLHVNGKVTYIGEELKAMSYTNVLTPEEYEETTASQMLTEFFDWLSSRLPRETYAENFERPVADIVGLIFDKTEAERETLLGYLTSVGDAATGDFMVQMQLAQIMMNAMAHRSDYVSDTLTDLIITILDANYGGEVAAILSAEEFAMIKADLYPVVRTLLPILVDDLYYHEGVDYDEYYATIEGFTLSDYDYGYSLGHNNGNNYGYTDGFDGSAYNQTLKDMEDLGADYEQGYTEGYKKAYKEAYELGAAHAADLVERGNYDGAKAGRERGFSEGQNGDPCEPTDKYFYRDSWMTDEYVEAYNAAFAEAYAVGYAEGGLTEPTEEPALDILAGYHFASIIKNATVLIANHLPQNIFEYLKALDSYYGE